jgi:hypothetical protein
MVHLTIDAALHSGTFSPTRVDDKVIDTPHEEHHFCEQCADDYDREEGMNFALKAPRPIVDFL